MFVQKSIVNLNIWQVKQLQLYENDVKIKTRMRQLCLLEKVI